MDLKRFIRCWYLRTASFLFLFFLSVVFWGSSSVFAQQEEDYKILREIIINEFKDHKPTQQGGVHSDVKIRFKSEEKKIVISLAACLDMGADIDMPLLNKLAEQKIPFSIFSDQAWLKKNETHLKTFLGNPLVQFENHGAFCRALSVDGQSVESASKTANLEDVFEEIEDNARAIERFSGRLPRFYRSGQDYYDDVSLKIVNVLGYQAVAGDLKLKSKDVDSDKSMQLFLGKIQPGSILFIPVNRPGTSEQWANTLLQNLRRTGYSVIALDDAIAVEEEL